MPQTRLKLGLEDQGRPITAEEFSEAEFDEPYRYERVEGRLVVVSPGGLAHTRMVSAILEHLFVYKSRHQGVVELIASESWIRTSDNTDRIGDIAVYPAGSSTESDRIYEIVPTLVFEVVSEGSEERDYVAKRREYYDLGVREYIIVDPFRKVLTVLTRGRQDYVDRELKPGDIYTSTQLPGFELPVADLPW